MFQLEFESGFRKLCSAFGISYSEARCRVYQEKFEHLDEVMWRRIVGKWIAAGSSFPKISDLLNMPEYISSDRPKRGPETYLEYLQRDCDAEECIDALIAAGKIGREWVPRYGSGSTEGLDYERLGNFRCPRCKRADADYPAFPLWNWDLTIRSRETMEARRKERREILLTQGELRSAPGEVK